jgi:hypothetical protein
VCSCSDVEVEREYTAAYVIKKRVVGRRTLWAIEGWYILTTTPGIWQETILESSESEENMRKDKMMIVCGP